MSKPFCKFPDDFVWGTATSSYQIEGAAAADGRTPSVWDTFCRRPGAVARGQTGDVATDHYHRYEQDVALMKDLGVNAYRFSVSWSRVLPDGTGRVNQKGLDFYRRLLDALRAANIQPWMTLFHWDLPQWAEDKWRGWESKDCATAFADYATVMTRALGNELAGVFTVNEFRCFLDMGYTTRETEHFAPGKDVSPKVLNQARHHAVYAHGLAAQAVRAAGPAGLRVGLAENIPNVVPVLESREHVAAAREALREMTGMFLTPILEGRYHPSYLEQQGPDAPAFTDDEMRVIATPLDFVGLNLYAPVYVRHDPAAPRGWSAVPAQSDYPRMHMPWLYVGPSILYWAPRLVCELWNVPAVYVTENGCAADDVPAAGSGGAADEVYDTGRVMYLQEHLIHAHRAVAEGYPLKGYFLWSLTDNFEWTWGYTRRFGIHHVNYETLARTPKLSASFYADVIRRNALGGD